MNKVISKRTVRRYKDRRWCEIKIELRQAPDGFLELSICGSEGRILTRKQARAEAIGYWVDFFNDDEAEFGRFVREYGVRTVRGAAKKVVEIDGEFHGLDVHAEEGDDVLVTESCGQIRDDLVKWFPECVPYLARHLNGLHAGCEHQDAATDRNGRKWSTDEPCPKCGYKYGSAWTRRELPTEVVKWAKTFGADDDTEAKGA